MKLFRREFLQLAMGIAVFPTLSNGSQAQSYPSRPITMIVPFPAGGPTDVTARIMADRMRLTLRQPVIIENVAGAAGTIGIGRVARAPPDGYTLSFGPGFSTHVINAAIYSLTYDVRNDFEPVALVSRFSHLIVARKSLAADDLNGLIAWLKANPGKVLQATSGVGSAGHVFGVLFQKETGTDFGFVPYRGAAEAMQDLIAGRVDLMIDTPVNCLSQVRVGAIKVYAVTAKNRLATAPDIPTVDEAGLPGFYGANWYSIYTSKGTPAEIVTKLNAAVVEALADPAVRKRLAELGHEIMPREQQTPEALRALQEAETEKWWPIIKAANIKGD
jgi:tripartite-type tricarboxylate transporter receptor subunit TctC